MSANSTTNITKWSSQQGSKNTLTPTINTSGSNSQNTNSYKALNYSPDKKRNLYTPSTPSEAQQQHSSTSAQNSHNHNQNTPHTTNLNTSPHIQSTPPMPPTPHNTHSTGSTPLLQHQESEKKRNNQL